MMTERTNQAGSGEAPAGDGFYGRLPVFDRFDRLTDPAIYTPLPDQWVLGLSDIVRSTAAIDAGRQRRPVRHSGESERLDHFVACAVAPDLARETRAVALESGRARHAVHIAPLLDDLGRVHRLDGRVGAAVPDRNPGPRPAMR